MNNAAEIPRASEPTQVASALTDSRLRPWARLSADLAATDRLTAHMPTGTTAARTRCGMPMPGAGQ